MLCPWQISQATGANRNAATERQQVYNLTSSISWHLFSVFSSPCVLKHGRSCTFRAAKQETQNIAWNLTHNPVANYDAVERLASGTHPHNTKRRTRAPTTSAHASHKRTTPAAATHYKGFSKTRSSPNRTESRSSGISDSPATAPGYSFVPSLS